LPARVFDADSPELTRLRSEIVAHEVAHQYFFNAIGVTEPGDAWISEAFAEHLATLYSRETLDSDDHARSNYWGYVLRVPPLEDEPVVSPTIVSNPRYFEIVYLKGSSVLWLLRRAVGDETWRDFLSGLVLRFSGSIATTAEVVEFAREQLGDTFRAHERWLVEGGLPVIEARTTRAANGSARLTLEARPNPLGGFEVRLPLESWTTDGAREVQLIDLPARGPVAVDLPETVRSVRIDPELTTFRRVRPQDEADVNLSGVVDGLDLLDLWSAGDVVSPSPRWDDRLDVNADGAIDALDVQRVRDALGDGLP
jgi:aminopeptidase N